MNQQPRKVVIVTGASHGIGAGLAEAFRKRDYCVVANALTIEPSSDPNVLAVAGDISRAETAAAIVSGGLRQFGRIDTLVNNAGIFIAKPFTEYTEADLANMLATNLSGFFHVTQAAIAPMIAQASGHVVNITASDADQPSSQHPSLLVSLTKGGLAAATKALAIEYAARGIRANAVAPGIIKTQLQSAASAASYEGLEKFVPLGRLGEIQNVVDAVLFLESDSFVSGEILHVDGARSAGV
jgi:NAD(P)-dependent dehydrogenase (short-subunit alcohol dehydrogenase family)